MIFELDPAIIAGREQKAKDLGFYVKAHGPNRTSLYRHPHVLREEVVNLAKKAVELEEPELLYDYFLPELIEDQVNPDLAWSKAAKTIYTSRFGTSFDSENALVDEILIEIGVTQSALRDALSSKNWDTDSFKVDHDKFKQERGAHTEVQDGGEVEVKFIASCPAEEIARSWIKAALTVIDRAKVEGKI